MNVKNADISYPIYLVILALPFLIFHWMMPFIANVTIGSDYLLFPIRQQVELFFPLKTGSFPLYVPGFASGHSSSALTLGQMFHPLSYLASIMPGYWSGKVIEWNNFFKLLSLGITQLALFAFIRKIGLNKVISFLLSFIAVYNLRVPNLYRYGAHLEAFTAHLLLCVAAGWYFVSPTKWIGPSCIIGATYLLVCSGHPQMMYFGFVGSGLFVLVVPFILSTMIPERKVDFNIAFKYWVQVGFWVCLGILLSSAYILPFFSDFLKANSDRVGQNYEWANKNLDTFIGTLNNFILPLRSEANSSFGGSSIILIAAILPILRCFKIKIPPAVWVIWGILLFMFIYMQGSRTIVHRLAWEYLPFASSIRVPGRISMVMPIFIMILLIWVIRLEPFLFQWNSFSFTCRPSVVLACFSLFITLMYYLMNLMGYYMFSLPVFQPYVVGSFLNIPFVWIEFIVIMLGGAALVTFAFYSMHNGAAKVTGILIIIIVVQQGIVLKYRSAFWIEKKYSSPAFEEILKGMKTKLDYPYYPGGGLHSSVVMTQINESFMEPFLGKIFSQVIPVGSQDEAYERMRIGRLPQQIFIEGYSAEKAKAITEGAKHMNDGSVALAYSSFNRLRFHVNSGIPALLGLSYPYTGHWNAWVNGNRVHVYRANGAAHAVEIPAGQSVVEFRYWSNAYFWGVVISCATLAIVGLFVCFSALGGLPRTAVIICILILSVGVYILWYTSLYNGDNLETEYTWTYTPQLKTPNLAYGKECWLSPDANPMPFEHTKKEMKISALVDGDIRSGSGFSSRLSDSPSWYVDLTRNESIKEILLYESVGDTSRNVRPLVISSSNDASDWRTVVSLVSLAKRDGPTRVVFENPETARYIRITVSGESILSFDEVEVYGP